MQHKWFKTPVPSKDVMAYRCAYKGCDLFYRTILQLKIHYRTYPHEKLKKVSKCPFISCSYNGNLKKHLTRHGIEDSFSCKKFEAINKAIKKCEIEYRKTPIIEVDGQCNIALKDLQNKTLKTIFDSFINNGILNCVSNEEEGIFCRVPGCHKHFMSPIALIYHIKNYKHHISSIIQHLELDMKEVLNALDTTCDTLAVFGVTWYTYAYKDIVSPILISLTDQGENRLTYNKKIPTASEEDTRDDSYLLYYRSIISKCTGDEKIFDKVVIYNGKHYKFGISDSEYTVSLSRKVFDEGSKKIALRSQNKSNECNGNGSIRNDVAQTDGLYEKCVDINNKRFMNLGECITASALYNNRLFICTKPSFDFHEMFKFSEGASKLLILNSNLEEILTIDFKFGYIRKILIMNDMVYLLFNDGRIRIMGYQLLNHDTGRNAFVPKKLQYKTSDIKVHELNNIKVTEFIITDKIVATDGISVYIDSKSVFKSDFPIISLAQGNKDDFFTLDINGKIFHHSSKYRSIASIIGSTRIHYIETHGLLVVSNTLRYDTKVVHNQKFPKTLCDTDTVSLVTRGRKVFVGSSLGTIYTAYLIGRKRAQKILQVANTSDGLVFCFCEREFDVLRDVKTRDYRLQINNLFVVGKRLYSVFRCGIIMYFNLNL